MTTGTAHERVAELESVVEQKAARADEILHSDAVTIDGANVTVHPDAWAEMKTLHDDQQQIKTIIETIKAPVSIKSIMDGLDMEQKGQNGDGFSAAMALAASGLGDPAALLGNEFKSLGEAFVGSEEFKNLVKSGGATMPQAWTMDLQDVTSLGTFQQKDVFTSRLTGAVNPRGFGRVQFDPAVPRQQRQYRVRDLFTVANTSANLIDYFRVLGFAENGGDGNAGTVRERAAADGTSAPVGDATDTFGMKPKSNLTFQSAQAPVRTIAHWEAAHRNVLQDEPQLQSLINNELLYGLALEEDQQILNGDGNNENLLGLLNTPNVQTYTQTGGEPKSDALRRAATKAIIANYAPTGYVIHPYDWEDIELQKDAEERYMLLTNVSVGMESRIWRQRVVETVAMQEGKFATGAWGLGAQLYDRQVANIRIAEQHADFFVRNAVAVLCEERLAFAVKRPESFVIGTFA